MRRIESSKLPLVLQLRNFLPTGVQISLSDPRLYAYPKSIPKAVLSALKPTGSFIYLLRVDFPTQKGREIILPDRDLRVLTKEEFLQSIRDSQESSVLLYVHGFATKFDDALYRLAQIKYDTAYDGIPIAFCWPSRGEMNLIDYNHDRDSVIASTNAFSELLQLLHTTAHVSKIYIVAHSMGSQVVVNSIAGSSDARKIPLAELVLAAPDISWEVFRAAAQQLTDAVKKVTLYASTTDQALRFSDTWNGAQTPRAGLLLSGTHQNVPSDIETIDVSALGADMFGFAVNHDIPFRARSALGDVGRLLRYGIHPPNDRSPGEILGVPEGSTHPEYWIFPK
jgi:hypothetical protein